MVNTALITGASAGIGAAFARELAARQKNLILVARSQTRLEQLAQQLQASFPIQVRILVQDLAQAGAVEAVGKAVAEAGMEVDLLVNNAGFGDYGAFSERELSRQLEMIQLNIAALVEMTHRFLPAMQQRRSGSIINVSSIAAFQPLPYLSIYAATKAFVLSFTEALWAENQDTGVHFLALCPGPTETEFARVAAFPPSLGKKNQRGIVTAEAVVSEALQALEKKQVTAITGGLSNQIIVNLPRFLPRPWLVTAVEKQFRV